MPNKPNSETPQAKGEGLLPRRSIQVLPEGVANRIAAGEVVERPASVVKELVENALDAQASSILVGVQRAGLDEILVADNGWGMDEEDLALAFRRHATSKISSAEDLNRILQLGFRGEALPSIGSVARIEVLSQREDRESGVRLQIDGGSERNLEPAARERGTTMRIRSLFYNVPARRKFLRTPATEYGHVVKVFKQYAIAYPDLRWELQKEGEVVWTLEPSDLKGRIGQLFGEEAAADLHEVESRSGGVFVEGVVGGTSLFRRSRGEQYLFVNRRPFQNNSLNHAVVNGFGPLIFPGQYPFHALQLRLEPEEFDVNVHPAKHEVRFRDNSLVYRAVLVAVRNALGLAIKGGGAPVQAPISRSGEEMRERAQGEGRSELELLFSRQRDEQPQSGDRGAQQAPVPQPPAPGDKLYRRGHKAGQGERDGASVLGEAAVGMAPTSPSEWGGDKAVVQGGIYPHEASGEDRGGPGAEASFTGSFGAGTGRGTERVNVWQLHRTYILSQTKSGLVIIDQHVAHERILFERALSAMGGRHWSGQQLLFPTQVELDPADAALLEELAMGLARVGFEVEPFGGNEWVIRAVPSTLRVANEERLLREIIADYREEHQVRLKPEESLAASFACKAAIKAGDPLNLQEMNTLIDELFGTEYPFVCPHGRPVVVNLTLSELHKMFGRE